MQKVYITSIYRTPIGKFLGSLSETSPVDLGADLLQRMIEKGNIPTQAIDEVIIGNVLSAGHGQNMARQIALKAGLAQSIPAYTVNMVCGSGLKAVYEGFIKIQAGIHQALIVGGVESMSQAPFLTQPSARKGMRLGDSSLVDSLLRDGLTDGLEGYHMGHTAECLAQDYHITREAQDDFAYQSQLKARAADFSAEIIPTATLAQDEYINYTTTLEKLASLRTVFQKDGTVTAGNASGINDGAALMCLVSEATLKAYGLTPLAEIIAFGQSGVDPERMGIGPVDAIATLLESQSLSLDAVDVLELNEAFAAQALAVEKGLSERLGVSADELRKKTNPKGGAISLGHPIGASGARILTTLVHELQPNAYGIASLCIGGGMGIAALIRKEG